MSRISRRITRLPPYHRTNTNPKRAVFHTKTALFCLSLTFYLRFFLATIKTTATAATTHTAPNTAHKGTAFLGLLGLTSLALFPIAELSVEDVLSLESPV